MGNAIKKFWIRADARLIARIDKIAKREKRTRQAAVQVLLERGVEYQEEAFELAEGRRTK